MTFEISTAGGRRSFCGVSEFTAEERTAVVPQWMAKNLELGVGDEVHVRRVYVPKGIYMKLQPHDARYARLGDTKRTFEWVLRRYTAVAAGDTLVVNYRGEDHAFDILDVSPGRAIRLIDADVAVDFAPPLSGEEVPKQPLETEGTDNANHDNNAPLPSSGHTLGGSVMAAVPSVPAVAQPAPGQALGTTQEVEGTEGVDWKRCDNCRRTIAMASYDRHVLQCARFNWYCEVCQYAVEKRKQQEHLDQMHSSLFCECGHECEARLLTQHKAEECPLRQKECSFCKLSLPHREMWSHEKECGSKTEKCDACGLYIRIRDLPGHSAVCGIPDKDLPPRNDYDYYGQAGMDDWGGHAPFKEANNKKVDDFLICPHCQQPCERLDDLQVHILVTHPDQHSELIGEADDKKSKEDKEEDNKQDKDSKKEEDPSPAPFVFDGNKSESSENLDKGFKFDPNDNPFEKK